MYMLMKSLRIGRKVTSLLEEVEVMDKLGE
jgi:hypothetical protein